jgi:hypothetical protein
MHSPSFTQYSFRCEGRHRRIAETLRGWMESYGRGSLPTAPGASSATGAGAGAGPSVALGTGSAAAGEISFRTDCDSEDHVESADAGYAWL